MAGLRKITLKWDVITGHLECDTSYVKREERVDVDLYVYESGTLAALATGWALNLTIKPVDLGDNAPLVAITSWSASATTGLYQATTQAISSTELDDYLDANNSDTTDDEGPVEVDLDIYYTVSAAMKAKSDTRTLTLKPDVGRTDDGTPIGTAVSITSSGYTMSTGKLLGRGTASAGAIEEITLGTNLSLSGTTLSANDTSVAIGEITGLGSGVATFLATPSSANLRSAVTDESGTGALLFAGGNIGAASGTSLALTGAATASNIPTYGATTADWTIPNGVYGEPPSGGAAVTAGTYHFKMHGVLNRTSGTDDVVISVNSNQSLSGPAFSDGAASFLGSIDAAFSALASTSLAFFEVNSNPASYAIVVFEGYATFSEAGTFNFAAGCSGPSDVVILKKGAFVTMTRIS